MPNRSSPAHASFAVMVLCTHERQGARTSRRVGRHAYKPLACASLRSCLRSLCVTLAAIPASAQYRASLQGTVTDPQGAVVPGATVTLTDKETNRTLETVTNETGVYVFNALAARTYTLSVELAGFKKKVLDDVKIIAEQSNALNVQLELGQTNEVVTVGAAAPLIDTATGNISGTVTARAASERCRRSDAIRCSCCSSRPARSATARAGPAAARRICPRRRLAAAAPTPASSPPRTAARSSPTARAPARTTTRSTASA